MISGPREVPSVTTAPESLALEQESRIKRYLITMGIRTTCFLAAVPLHGWMRWTAVALAVLLPYIAVVLANAVKPRPEGTMTYAGTSETPVWLESQPAAKPSGAERVILEGQIVTPDDSGVGGTPSAYPRIAKVSINESHHRRRATRPPAARSW